MTYGQILLLTGPSTTVTFKIMLLVFVLKLVVVTKGLFSTYVKYGFQAFYSSVCLPCLIANCAFLEYLVTAA